MPERWILVTVQNPNYVKRTVCAVCEDGEGRYLHAQKYCYAISISRHKPSDEGSRLRLRGNFLMDTRCAIIGDRFERFHRNCWRSGDINVMNSAGDV